MEQRKHYRIDDILPIITRRVENHEVDTVLSRVVCGFPIFKSNLFITKSEIEPDSVIWSLLVEMNEKLNFIIQRLNLQSEGFELAQNRQVSLSEGSIDCTIPERYDLDDVIEVKLVLNALQYTALVLYGRVARIQELTGKEYKEYKVSIVFMELEEGIKELLCQYMLQRQRDRLKKRSTSSNGD